MTSELISFDSEDRGFCEIGAEAEEAVGHRISNVIDFKISDIEDWGMSVSNLSL